MPQSQSLSETFFPVRHRSNHSESEEKCPTVYCPRWFMTLCAMLIIVGLTFIMSMETDGSRDREGGASETNEPSFGDFRVRSVIILQDKPHDRERLLLKFLKIMKHLRKLSNFNSYLSILSALDSAPLRRLDWQKSTSEALEEFSTLIDSSSSFRAYRAALAEVEPPCIPYLYVPVGQSP
ncbi:rap guanine nucleotide exchange factor 1-like [Neolamprologus brichardi]|uniref:rap guanine nucleotide exchange factor 1-like n=1 Tax=Neolamprologus brichardi TaxID=32507 RepID=UPI001643D1EE|nr:rap guanine nucleotide exchange factor 1-like [Neolamprologus brichardi]